MALDPARRFPLMAITQHGVALGHAEQVRRLCAAGVRWVQLRMKDTPRAAWLAAAREAVAACRAHGAVCIVNDSVEIALESGADGVHLGRLDLEWRQARRQLGPDRILGGTVNTEADAQRAVAAACLDYVGVGPLRFTRTKKELAPLRGFDGIRTLVTMLPGLPAWGIGGVEVADVAPLRALGVAGTAVCSALLRGDTINENVAAFQAAWPAAMPSSLFPA